MGLKETRVSNDHNIEGMGRNRCGGAEGHTLGNQFNKKDKGKKKECTKCGREGKKKITGSPALENGNITCA